MGFDGTIRFLKCGIAAWKNSGKDYDTISSLLAAEVQEELNSKEIAVFDVGKVSEFQSEHVVGAINTPLSNLNNHLTEFPEKSTFYVHCAGGYRSVIAASILKSRGIHNFVDVAAIKDTDIEVSNFVCLQHYKGYCLLDYQS